MEEKQNLFYDFYENEKENEKEDIGCVSTPCLCFENTVCVFCEQDKQSLDNTDDIFSQKVHFNVNYTVKQLKMICEYYGLMKILKACKMTMKNDLIEAITVFESNPINSALVFQRKKIWFYFKELEKDTLMKKFIIHNGELNSFF